MHRFHQTPRASVSHNRLRGPGTSLRLSKRKLLGKLGRMDGRELRTTSQGLKGGNSKNWMDKLRSRELRHYRKFQYGLGTEDKHKQIQQLPVWLHSYTNTGKRSVEMEVRGHNPGQCLWSASSGLEKLDHTFLEWLETSGCWKDTRVGTSVEGSLGRRPGIKAFSFGPETLIQTIFSSCGSVSLVHG